MFVAIFRANPEKMNERESIKPSHDEYWRTRLQYLQVAGPILSDDGRTKVGQVLVIDLPNKEAAEELVANDPFVRAGLFAEYSVRRFRVSVEAGRSK